MRYVDGELNAAEKAAVEQRLQSDSAFRDQFRDLQVALQAIRHLGTMQQVEGIREVAGELNDRMGLLGRSADAFVDGVRQG